MTHQVHIEHPDLLCPGCGTYAYCCLCADSNLTPQCRLCEMCVEAVRSEMERRGKWRGDG